MQHISLFLGEFQKQAAQKDIVMETIKTVFKRGAGIELSDAVLKPYKDSVRIELTPIEKSVALEHKERLEALLKENLGGNSVRFM
jgi:hypothetical protein